MARDEAAVRARLDYVRSRLGPAQGSSGYAPQSDPPVHAGFSDEAPSEESGPETADRTSDPWDHDEPTSDGPYDALNPNEASELSDDPHTETAEFTPAPAASEAAVDEWLPEALIRPLPEDSGEPDHDELPADPAAVQRLDPDPDEPQPAPAPAMAPLTPLISEAAPSSPRAWSCDPDLAATAGASLSQPRWMVIAEAALDQGLINSMGANAEPGAAEWSEHPSVQPRAAEWPSSRVPPDEFSASKWVPHTPELRSPPLAPTEEWSPPYLTPTADRPEPEQAEVEPAASEATGATSEWRPQFEEEPAEDLAPPEAPRFGPEAWQPPLDQQAPPVESTRRDPIAWQPTPVRVSEPEPTPAADPSQWAPASSPVNNGAADHGSSETASRWVPDVLEAHERVAEPRLEEEASAVSTSASEWLPEELARAERRVRPRRRR